MIYRILVDFRNHTEIVLRTELTLSRRSLERLSRVASPALAGRLSGLLNKTFVGEAALLDAARKAIGRELLQEHRTSILVAAQARYPETRKVAFPWRGHRGRLHGPGYGWLANVMDEHGLVAPDVENRRARFYFTERGWERVGRHVVAEAGRLGHVVKVVRRKEPEVSRVVYEDELQVALLPMTRAGPSRPRG